MGSFSKKDAAESLGLSMIFGLDKVVDTQNEIRQSEVVNSSILPKQGDWDLLQSWGVQRLDEAGDLFFNCILPEGWKTKATYHPIHSHLLDERGLKRAHIVYKASFYDRNAHIKCHKSRFIVNGSSGLKDFQTVFVYDNGRDVAVASFGRMQYASMGEVVGVLLGGKFYTDPQGYSMFRDEKAFNTCIEVVSSAVQVLTLKEFDREVDRLRVGDEDIRWKFTASIDELVDEKLRSKARAFVKSLPSDNPQWSSEYDLPAVSMD